jgi:fusaric acid resistance family protein
MAGRSYELLSKLRLEARAAAVVLAGTLAAFGAALVVERLAHLHADVVVLAVVLALTHGRRGASRGRDAWAVLAVPLVAVAATQLATLMRQHEYAGDALFAVVVTASVFLRRYGPLATRVGGYLAMPFIALLIVPVPLPARGQDDNTRALWAAAVAALAIACATLAHLLAERGHLLATAAPNPGRERAARRIVASDRMAAQLAVALAAAFVVGHLVFGRHWPWPVLTAYILCSPNHGRADVAYKGVLRLAGALAGMVPATLLAGAFASRDRTAVVLIFVALGVGTWLRGLNYAFWAASVTAALSLLYGYYGDAGAGALGGRLGGILAGAVIGVAASWLVLPLRTTDVLRRRTATALAALTELLQAAPAVTAAHLRAYEHALAQLAPLAQPLSAQRMLHHVLLRHLMPRHLLPRHLLGRHRPDYGADTVDALRRSLPAVRAVVAWYGTHQDTPPEAARRRAALLRTIGAARKALRTGADRTPQPARQEPARQHPARQDPAPSGIDRALADLQAALVPLPVAVTPALS